MMITDLTPSKLYPKIEKSPKTGSLKADWMFDVYFDEFRPWQDKPVKLLELGVYQGGSLTTFQDFFARGAVYGVDKNPVPELSGQEERKYFVGAQQDKAFLDRVAEKVAPDGFDIIIDDASHIGALTKISFWHLFEHHLKPGGIFVIEDWLTGYGRMRPGGQCLTYDPKDVQPENGLFHGHQYGMAGFLKELVDEFARHMFMTPEADLSRSARFSQLKIVHNVVVIRKLGRHAFDMPE